MIKNSFIFDENDFLVIKSYYKESFSKVCFKKFKSKKTIEDLINTSKCSIFIFQRKSDFRKYSLHHEPEKVSFIYIMFKSHTNIIIAYTIKILL